MSGFYHVIKDWRQGIVAFHYWWRFGLLDMNLKYRRTILGPFWLTLTFAGTAAGLATVYSTLFKVDNQQYIPYLVTGLAVWAFVAGLVTDGCLSLTRHAHMIREHNLPILAHACRALVGHAVAFSHNALVVAGTILYFETKLDLFTLLIIPAFLLMLINGLWITLFFGLVCARFRDLPPLISVVVNLLFLVTPVFWYRDMLGDRGMIADVNPLYHFLEVMRAPILGAMPDSHSIIVVAIMTIGGWVATLLVAWRLQPQLAYWV